MSAAVISFSAARTARLLRENAPPPWVERFIARMTRTAQERHDFGREIFWREVATLLERAPRRMPMRW